ncbi:MAG: tRNA lysidine(34) synthetase TilS [Planctomycetes bacterium]|nr:tRNA lysidine(34) synthetase TilS [Planctomycetota bacterium]
MQEPKLPYDFFKFLTRFNIITPNDHILLACSGGADSIALLHLFTKDLPKRWQNLRVSVAHLNHQIQHRADEMQEFVKSLCKKLNVPFYSDNIDVLTLRQSSKKSIEHIARYVRYEFLEKTAKNIGANFIATGHNRGDQEETILMMILQGSGITGLRGMPMKRRFMGEDKINLVRPLLEFSRSEITKYLGEKGIKYLDDPTNEDTAYLRNRIRHNILPYLEKEGNPQIRKHLRGIASEIKSYFEEKDPEIENLIKQCWRFEGDNPFLDLNLIKDESTGKISAVLVNVFRDIGISSRDINRNTIENLLEMIDKKEGTKEMHLPGNWVAVKTLNNRLVFKNKRIREIRTRELEYKMIQKHIQLSPSGDTGFRAWSKNFTLRVVQKPVDDTEIAKIKAKGDRRIVCMQTSNAYTTPFKIRRRHRGDKFRPLGAKGYQKLKKFFINRKIEKDLRDDWPILVDSFGNIIWVMGMEIAHDARVSSHLFPAMYFRIIEEEDDTFPRV